MSSIYFAIAISALADGIFSGFYIRTGIDANPSALGIKIIDMLSPYIPHTLDPQIEIYKFLILAIPWIVTIITILKAPSKIFGLIIWASIFAAVTLFVGYYDAETVTLVMNQTQ